MTTCARCGAQLDPSAVQCPYCQTQTPHGRALADRHAAYQYQAAQAEQARRHTEQQTNRELLRKKGLHAMLWSLAGMLMCCLPGAVVGLVMGLNVKSSARQAGTPAPGTSTAAVVLSVCSVAISLGLIALYVIESRALNARIGTLQTQLSGVLERDTLSQPSACALVELRLLEDGYDAKGGINIQGFRCDGKLELEAEHATLRDVQFRTSSSESHVVTACLVRGNRWSIKELRSDGTCSGAAPATSTAPIPSAR